MTIKKSSGFTVIELIFVIALFGFASILFFVQKNNLNIVNQDNEKKIAINAMYYSLEEVFYVSNGYYPQTINSSNLKSVDPSLFTDSSGIKINTDGSAYTYTPLNCNDNKCKSYKLKATLAKESDYIKTSRF
jgi:type II secretory pathway pseudopilin PulG